MGCPNCAERGFRKRKCKICGKDGCENCFIFLFNLINSRGIICDTFWACSEKCLETFGEEIKNKIQPEEIVADDTFPPIRYFVERTVLSFDKSNILSSWVLHELRSKNKLNVFFDQRSKPIITSDGFNKKYEGQIENPDNLLWKNVATHARLIQAKHFETLQEFENAAKIYKSLGMYEEAGKVRAKSKEVTIKKTNISVDLNALLRQVKEGGMVIIYRCPHCNATLKIGGKTELKQIRICEHCGSEIESLDLAEFLKTALS